MRWNTLAQRVGKNIKKIRVEKKLTQEKAADLTRSMSVRHWQYLEKGQTNCTLKSLTAIARALKIDPSELLKK